MIFITGCNGLVGSSLVRTLISNGEKVRALKRPLSDLSLIEDIKSQIEWIEGDICDTTLLDNAVKGVDTIIHTAAIVSYAPGDKEAMYKINVEGTANIVNAALVNSVNKFCHVSSVAAIGKKKNQKSVDENTKFEDSEFSSTYGLTKYLAEMEVYRGIEEGLNAFIVNPSIILGPGNWNKSSSKLFKYVWKENIFYTDGKMNYIDIRDVTSIIIQLMTLQNISGQKFILNAGNISYNEFFTQVAKSFNKKAPAYKVTPLIAELAWRFESIRSTISGKEPFITKETARLSRQEFFYINTKVKNLLNYEFIDIKETINWSCNQLLVKNS